MKKKLSLKRYLFMLTLCICLVGVIATIFTASYAFFTTRVTSKEFVVYTGTLKVDYEKKTNVLNLEDLYPMTNSQGLELETNSHEFTITNNGNIQARYQIRLEVDDKIKNQIPIEYIKLSYSKNGSNYSEPVLLSNLNSSLVFVRNQILASKDNENNNRNIDTYSVKLWIDISAPNEIQGKEFRAKIVVDSIQDVEDGYVVDTVPIITLKKDEKGNQDIHLKVNESYQELGVEKIEDDNDILTVEDVNISYEYYDSNQLTEVESVDTSKVGIYYITYSVTDKENNTGQAVRIVTINNTDMIPSIELKGEETITLEETDDYIEQGVTVEEGNQVVTLGEVKTSTIGTYTIRYIVIDKNGNLNSIVRTVNIVEATTLQSKILTQNTLITTAPTLTTSSNNTSDKSGLYSSTVTNDNKPTYYFRGNVENNYVEFAGFTWRVVRINEDGTIRLIMQDGINNNTTYPFNPNGEGNGKDYMYYTNSNGESGAKYTLDSWYQTNIINKGYSSYVASGNYFCEQARVAYSGYATNSGADMVRVTEYTPDFKCATDKNKKGLVNASVGLITYDEVVFAGAYYKEDNTSFYLYNNFSFWTMSPAGTNPSLTAWVWRIAPTSDHQYGFYLYSVADYSIGLRPVINLNIDTKAIGLGTIDKPYKIVY